MCSAIFRRHRNGGTHSEAAARGVGFRQPVLMLVRTLKCQPPTRNWRIGQWVTATERIGGAAANGGGRMETALGSGGDGGGDGQTWKVHDEGVNGDWVAWRGDVAGGRMANGRVSGAGGFVQTGMIVAAAAGGGAGGGDGGTG